MNRTAGCQASDNPRDDTISGTTLAHAPELQVERWFNADEPISLEQCRGKVVLLCAFQMLCPACVTHTIPQAQRLHALAHGTDLVVLGLHTVFEHHAAMTAVALEAFLHEYRVSFPVGVDRPAPAGPIPRTMAAYRMRGTPSTVVIDRAGRLVRHAFGAEDDLALGLVLGEVLGGGRTERLMALAG